MKLGVVENWNNIINRLQTCYDLATNANNDPSFYINLINYVSIFDKSPMLQEFIKSVVVPMSEEDHKQLNKYDDEIVTECVDIFDMLIKYINKNKIDDKTINNLTEQFFGHRDNRILSSEAHFFNPTFDFYFKLKIPGPNKTRLITERDNKGRILQSNVCTQLIDNELIYTY